MITDEKEALKEAETLFRALSEISVEDLTILGIRYRMFNAFTPGSAKRLFDYLKSKGKNDEGPDTGASGTT